MLESCRFSKIPVMRVRASPLVGRPSFSIAMPMFAILRSTIAQSFVRFAIALSVQCWYGVSLGDSHFMHTSMMREIAYDKFSDLKMPMKMNQCTTWSGVVPQMNQVRDYDDDDDGDDDDNDDGDHDDDDDDDGDDDSR